LNTKHRSHHKPQKREKRTTTKPDTNTQKEFQTQILRTQTQNIEDIARYRHQEKCQDEDNHQDNHQKNSQENQPPDRKVRMGKRKEKEE